MQAMNCGKQVYSRVARVCKSDEGGQHPFTNCWTTFLKVCSIPGYYPFYFNEINDTTEFYHGHLYSDGSKAFYAIFTTQESEIAGSSLQKTSTTISWGISNIRRTQTATCYLFLPVKFLVPILGSAVIRIKQNKVFTLLRIIL